MIQTLIVVVILALAGGLYLMFNETKIVPENDSVMVTQEDKNTQIAPSPTDTATSNAEVKMSADMALDLSSMGLTKTPDYVFKQTKVQKLDLSNNNLSGSLQAEVRFLQDLKMLDLSNNKLTGVPAEIGQLKNLEVLDLSNNMITGLPNELGSLTKLKQLNLKGNAYSKADLDVIKKQLTATVEVMDN